MAISITTLDARFNDIIIQDTDVDEVAKVDITGSTGSVYYIHVTNGWSGHHIYFKIYDEATVTIGTSHPIFIMFVADGATKACAIPDGLAFTSGLSYAVVEEAGTAGTTGASSVTVRMVTS